MFENYSISGLNLFEFENVLNFKDGFAGTILLQVTARLALYGRKFDRQVPREILTLSLAEIHQSRETWSWISLSL